MSWFKCSGGTGMPSGLQEGMDSVLNKKFATSTTYPAEGWPDDVNLLGLLEEKTQASASVCSFDDGADDVPTKSLVVTIPPTLSGVSSVSETQTGRNLCQNNLTTETVSGVTITVNADGTITLDGTATARITRNLCTNFEMKAGTYTLSCGTSELPSSCYFNINISGGGGGSCSRNTPSLLITLPETRTATYIRIDLANGSTFDNLVIYPMLEIGSTAHDYEPYTTPTTYTANLGRTIYGGTADIVNGVGTDENGNDFTFDGQEIPTRLGVNNFWSDSGDTEVTYRSSGTVTPVLPTLISKTITENGTYSAEDDGADGYDEVVVNVSGGGGGSCERLFYARCYDNYQVEIPTISSLVQGTNYSSYVSYSTSTKKFTALQDFTAVIIGWVYTYQTYEASYSQGAFVVNNKRLATYTATGKTQGSTGGAYMVYNFKQGDEFYPYTPSTDGYPRQNCKVYLVSDLDDDIYTFADEEA